MPVVVRAIRASAPRRELQPGRVQRVGHPVREQRLHAAARRRGSPSSTTPRAAGSRSRATATSCADLAYHAEHAHEPRPTQGPARRRAWTRSARRSPAAPRRCACPASPAAWRPRARPTAPRRTTGRRGRPRVRAHRRAVSIAVLVGDRDDLVEHVAVEHRAARSPRRSPGSCAGPGARPESTAELAGSTATTRQSGLRSLSTSPAPVIVPPVPTPATNTSTWPSSASQISGPVVRRWISGFAGLENWSGRNTSSRVAIARAASTASVMPPIDSVISTRAP